jgi:hypothetical protein
MGGDCAGFSRVTSTIRQSRRLPAGSRVNVVTFMVIQPFAFRMPGGSGFRVIDIFVQLANASDIFVSPPQPPRLL